MLEVIKVTTTGSAGAATGTTTDQFLVHGYLMGVRLEYAASPGASTIVTVTELQGLKRTLFTSPATGTAAPYNPQSLVNKPDGTASTFYYPYYLDGVNLVVTVAAGNAATDAIVAYFVIAKDIR